MPDFPASSTAAFSTIETSQAAMVGPDEHPARKADGAHKASKCIVRFGIAAIWDSGWPGSIRVTARLQPARKQSRAARRTVPNARHSPVQCLSATAGVNGLGHSGADQPIRIGTAGVKGRPAIAADCLAACLVPHPAGLSPGPRAARPDRMKSEHPAIKIKLQILCGEAIAMGPGKADLLDAIAAEGSISGAGRRMGMSYRRAWQLVDLMNRCWATPLVETSPGSARGGGARLTEQGAAVLTEYRALQAALEAQTVDARAAMLSARLRARPLRSQAERGDPG